MEKWQLILKHTTCVNVEDVNVATKRKITKEKMFQERKPRKNKSTTNWEKEDKLNKTMVDTIQQLQKAHITSEGFSTSMEGWNTTWLGVFDTTSSIETPKPLEFVISQSKLISIKEIFQDISKQMLETSYTLNLGMAIELKKYLWQKMKPNKS